MTAAGKKPNLTLVFHDAGAPIREVLRALHAGSRGRLKLTYRSIRQGPPNGANALVLRVNAKTVGVQDEPGEIETTVSEARRRAHCDLMDRLEVPNGCKSIAIALHEHWTDALSEQFGKPASPSSVKRWRADERRRRASWLGGHVQARHERRGAALERRVRIHHAIRVGAAGLTMRQGYRGALDELAALRAEHDGKHGTSLSVCPPFSYSTFRRECERITPSLRRTTGRRGRLGSRGRRTGP